MDEGWTLRGELEARGMSIEDACHACKMDYATMRILVEDAGKTLPQLALKVARGLGLTQAQAKTLGKPLNKKIWMSASSGLGKPKRINMDPLWYMTLKEPDVKRVWPIKPHSLEHRTWIEAGRVLQWLWDRRIDIMPLVHDNGTTVLGAANNAKNQTARNRMIDELVEDWHVPREIAETESPPVQDVHGVKWVMDAKKVGDAIDRGRYTRRELAMKAMRIRPDIRSEDYANKIVGLLLQRIRDGEPLVKMQVDMVCRLFGLDPFDASRLRIEYMVKKRWTAEEDKK